MLGGIEFLARNVYKAVAVAAAAVSIYVLGRTS